MTNVNYQYSFISWPRPSAIPLRKLLCSLAIALAFADSPVLATEFAAPPLMLASAYHGKIAFADYWVSEKFDGVRGYWDGEKLLTRGGERIPAPAWFTADWPKVPLDGELWVARGQFLRAVSTIRQKSAGDDAWRALNFMVFDLPAHGRDFSARNAALRPLIAAIGQPWVRHVEQFKVVNQAALLAELKRVVKQGGEGLALHRAGSHYQAARNEDLQKYKLYDDAEARVVAYRPGKGKYAGLLGALEVETPEGLRMRLGSGLSDELRRNPPALGTWISYRYNGSNEKTGIPRFARFMRVREDLPAGGLSGLSGL